MPPTAGAIAFQPDPALASRVERIARRLPLGPQPNDCAHTVAGNGCLASVACNVAINPQKDLLVVADGYFTQPKSLQAPHNAHPAALAQFALQLYGERGDAFVDLCHSLPVCVPVLAQADSKGIWPVRVRVKRCVPMVPIVIWQLPAPSFSLTDGSLSFCLLFLMEFQEKPLACLLRHFSQRCVQQGELLIY